MQLKLHAYLHQTEFSKKPDNILDIEDDVMNEKTAKFCLLKITIYSLKIA